LRAGVGGRLGQKNATRKERENEAGDLRITTKQGGANRTHHRTGEGKLFLTRNAKISGEKGGKNRKKQKKSQTWGQKEPNNKSMWKHRGNPWGLVTQNGKTPDAGYERAGGETTGSRNLPKWVKKTKDHTLYLKGALLKSNPRRNKRAEEGKKKIKKRSVNSFHKNGSRSMVNTQSTGKRRQSKKTRIRTKPKARQEDHNKRGQRKGE